MYLQYEMNVVLQMIPHWIMSCIGLINGLLWAIRGFTLLNMYMVVSSTTFSFTCLLWVIEPLIVNYHS